MNHVGPLVKEWSTFFSVLGGATATLLGLLFVAVSLHGRAIHEEQNSGFFRLARLTLSNYLMLLSLSLQMLVPVEREMQFRMVWAITAVVGLFWTIKLFWEIRKNGQKPDPFISRSYRAAFLSYILLFVLGSWRFTDFKETLTFIMLPVMFLVFGSIRNSWGLMTMIKPNS